MQDEANEKRNLLSIGEASEYLGVSIDTLRRWEKRGRIEPYRSPGGHRHYSKPDLDKLFDKKYVRDEPTVRSTGPYAERQENISQPPTREEVQEPPKVENYPHFNPYMNNPVNAEPAPITPLEVSQAPYPNQNMQNTTPQPFPQNEYSLPPWRNSETPYTRTEIHEEITAVTETLPRTQAYQEEQPEKEIKVPELQAVRIIQSGNLLSPEEAYIRQQNVSILNPHLSPNVQESSPANIAGSTKKENEGGSLVNQISDMTTNFTDKNLIIYISAGVGILILAITWFLLWRSSQAVLSPIP